MLPHQTRQPILILDKHGLLAEAFIQSLPSSSIVIVLTNRHIPRQKHVVVLPFGDRVPRVPDNIFSQIMVIDADTTDLRNFAPSLLEKSKQSQCPLVFINSVYSMSEQFLTLYGKISHYASLLLYADILSDERSYPNLAQRTLIDAVKKNKMKLGNSGMSLVYPIVEKDVLHQLHVLSKDFTSPAVYCLFSDTGMTELTLARMIVSHYSNAITVLESKGEIVKELYIPSSAQFLFPSDYPLQSRLGTLLATKLEQLSLPHAHVFRQKKSIPLPRLRYIFVSITALLLIILLPLLFAVLGAMSLSQSVKELELGHASKSNLLAKASNSFLSVANTTTKPLQTLMGVVGFTKQAQDMNDHIVAGKQGSQILELLNAGVLSLQDQDISTGLANFSFATTLMQRLQAENKLTILSVEQNQKITQLITLYAQMQPFLPEILGYTGPKQYLLLFLNSNELRPGGGFIGSYADMTIAKAQMSDMTIHDVYEVDGKLQGHVDPPKPLQQYLGVKNWFLRDSNFSIDQNENSRLAGYFYQLEANQKVSGTVTVDTFFMTHLLRLTGPIKVPEFRQTVTADNFFRLTEDHAEKNFFPGSQQKKTFLSAFNQALQEKLYTGSISRQQLFSFVLDSVRQKHLSLSFANEAITNGLSDTLLGLDSTDLHSNGGDGQTQDFFGLNEANVGTNKVNHYLTRSFQHSIQIDSRGVLSHTVVVSYTNTSASSSAYGGDYKTYIRAIIPHNAALSSIAIDGRVQALVPSDQSASPQYKGKAFLTNALSMTQETIADKSVIGFYTIVPQQASKTITISYVLPTALATAQQYSLMLYKQPGTDTDSVQLHVQAASPYQLSTKDTSFSSSPTAVLGRFDLATDREINLTISK